MTDYNDGKWHGWNGGECPVHPGSVVSVVFENGTQDECGATAINWNMSRYRPCAFRVVTRCVRMIEADDV